MRQRTLVTRAARMEVTPRGNFEFEGHYWLLLLPENLDLVFLRLLGVVVCEELLQCIAVRKVANGRGSRARERARKHSSASHTSTSCSSGELDLVGKWAILR